MRLALATLSCALATLAFPGLVLAGGSSPVEDYVLDLPNAGGGNEGAGGTEGAAPDDGASLAPGVESALESQGPDGAAAAELARATGPRREAERSGGSDQTAAATAADDDGAPGVADAITDAATSSDSGIGPALPILLALTLVGAVVLVVVHRRRQGSAGS